MVGQCCADEEQSPVSKLHNDSVCVCVCACVRACVRAYVCVCV